MRRGSGVSGGGAGGLVVAPPARTCRAGPSSSRYTDVVIAADDVITSVEVGRRRAGVAPRRSHSGAGMEIEKSSDDAALTMTVSGAGVW